LIGEGSRKGYGNVLVSLSDISATV
jgi:hypothetical protein